MGRHRWLKELAAAPPDYTYSALKGPLDQDQEGNSGTTRA